MTEAEVVQLLLQRNGRGTRVIAIDGEPMEFRAVDYGKHSNDPDYTLWADRGGIPISADQGRYYFYSNEVARIEDVETGELLLARDCS